MTDEFDRAPPTVAQVARAALTRRPSRKRDQTIFWGVRITRDLGFPAAVAWFLLTELPQRTERVLAQQAAAHRQEMAQLAMTEAQRAAELVAVLKDNDETIAALVKSVDSASQTAATVRGVLLGRRLCQLEGTRNGGAP